jgi:hypothetical protein
MPVGFVMHPYGKVTQEAPSEPAYCDVPSTAGTTVDGRKALHEYPGGNIRVEVLFMHVVEIIRNDRTRHAKRSRFYLSPTSVRMIVKILSTNYS